MFLGSTETWLFETQTNPRCTTEYNLILGMEKTDSKILDTPAKWRFVFVPGVTEVIRETYFSHKLSQSCRFSLICHRARSFCSNLGSKRNLADRETHLLT